MTARGFEFGRLISLAALSVWVTMVASLRLDAGVPVARWVADDWSGGTANWVDRVGEKIATSYGSPVKATTQFGGSAPSSGIVFDGVDDYFEVASDQNPIAGQNRVTIVALFKATQGATGTDGNHWNYPGPINAESGGSPNDFGLTIGTDGLAHAFFNESLPTFTPISVVDGLVHTMILTWADPSVGVGGDGTARFYVDGVLKGSLVTDGGSGIVADLIRFGRERETSTRWFRGTVGELRFYASIEDPAALHASMSNVVPTLGFLSTTEAAGGDVVPISDSNIHTFRQSGSFVPSTSGTVEVLVVGGGGGGGGSFAGGGGGGGGVVSSTSYAVNAGEPISVIVGLGGAGGSFSLQGKNGGDSHFGSLTAKGGGGGGTYPENKSGQVGGSGGGAGYAGVPGAGQVGQGSLGGTFGALPRNHGGGGGGAGGTPDSSGIGGVGVVSSISGSASYYAGGGAAGTDDSVPLAGGLGGGGVGGQGLVNGLSGVANTGGGGGGGGGLSTVPVGGSGGSGVVIVRYSSFRTLSVMGSATQSSFSTISGSVSGTDPDPNTTLVYGILDGVVTTAGQVSKTGSFGTLTLNTATGAYSFAPLATGINSLQTSASEGYTLTVTDGVATASVGLTVNILVEQLALTTQPAGVISGAIMKSPPVVEIRDSKGNRTASTGAVSVSIDSGTGGALSGTLSVNAVNGVATFSDLTMTGTLNTSYTLKFSSSGYKASSTRGQVEWAYVVRNGLADGRSLLYIDLRQFIGTGINPNQVNTIQLLGLYSGSVSWISTDPNSWSTFEIPSALSNIPDIAISYYSGSSNDSGVRLMRLGEESYGIQANFTFALPFTSTTSAAFTVNLPPTLAAIGVSGTEDTPLTFSPGNFSSGFTDPEGASLASIQIVSLPVAGTLTLAGSAAVVAQVIPVAQLGSLNYTPAAHENGVKTFTVKAFDGSAWSGPTTVTMTLAPVNDAPVAGSASFTAIAEDLAVADNAGTAVSVFANAGSDVDSSALKGIAITSVDLSNGSWQYTTDGGGNWSSLSGVSSASARLLKSDEQHRVRFVPNLNFNGTATIQYRAWDQVSGTDAALVDLTSIDRGAWALVAYGSNASLGGFLNAASGTFSSVVRSGSAVLPALSLLKSSSELAMSWTAVGGGFPVGGIASYSHAIAFPLPQSSAMSFDGTSTSPPDFHISRNAAISFAVGSTHSDQSLVTVRTLTGSPGMPALMYLRNTSFGAGYGGVYGLVMNDGNNPALDYGQIPDGQTFKAVYLDHGTGNGQQSGLVMGGAGGFQNSYVPSTMALWARLSAVQVSALEGASVSSSGHFSLAGVGTTYLDIDSSATYSANTATGTLTVTSVNDAPTLVVTPAALSYTDTAAVDTFAIGTETLVGADVDTLTPLTYGISGGGLANGAVSKVGTYGALAVMPATGAYTFTPNDPAINALSTSTTETFVVTVSDGESTTMVNLVINLTGVNDAPILKNFTLIGSEDTKLVLLPENLVGVYADAENLELFSLQVVDLPLSGTLSLSGTPVTTQQVIPAAMILNLTYDPAANESGVKTFTVRASDGSLWSALATVSINLTPVNDAPTTAGSASLASIDEDGGAVASGQTVANLFSASFSDAADGSQSSLAGIAITSHIPDSTRGVWQYSTSGGSWTALPASSLSAAVLVNSMDSLRFVPASNYNGAATPLEARLIESGGTSITSGQTVALSGVGAQIILSKSAVIGWSSIYSASFSADQILDQQTGVVSKDAFGNNYWLASDSLAKGSVLIDLGAATSLSKVELYNTSNTGYNGRNTGAFHIEVANSISGNSADSYALVDPKTAVSGTLADAVVDAAPVAQSFSLDTGGLSPRYVRFVVDSSKNDSPGLNELRLFSAVYASGGVSLFSANAVELLHTVNPVNDTPMLTSVDLLTGGIEDMDYTITYEALAAAGNESDIDNSSVLFRIGTVSSGSLTKNGVAVTPGSTLLAAGESVVWRPAVNANGVLEAFTVTAWDGLLASSTAVPVQILVTAAPHGLGSELLVNPGFELRESSNSLYPLGWNSTVGFVVFTGSVGEYGSPSITTGGQLAFGYSSSVVVSQTAGLGTLGIAEVSEFQLEYFLARNQQAGIYWVQVEFLSASGQVLAQRRQPSSGTAAAPSTWTTETVRFNRGEIAEFDQITQVRVSLFGQQSPLKWAGHYGPFFDYVSLKPSLRTPLAVSGITALGKVYDATTSAELNTAGANLVGVVSGDSVNLSVVGAVGVFSSPTVGATKAVTVSGLTLSGNQAWKYSLVPPAGLAAAIMAKTLTVSGLSGVNKSYDRTTAATVSGSAALSGVISSDTVTLEGTPVFTFASANVGAGIAITTTGYTLSGDQALNYSLTQPTGLTGTITAKALSIGAPTIASKVYDGTTAAGAVRVGALSGLVSPETLVVTGTADAYSSAAVGTYQTVVVSYTLANGSGNTAGLAANYSLAAGSASGTVTGRALTVTSAVVTSKAYDGTTSATITSTLSGVLNSDVVTLVGTGTFASKNVGANQVVTSTSTLSGTAAANYALTQPSGLTGTITAKALSIGAPTIASKVYDGTTAAGVVTVGELSGLISPETLTVSGTADAYSSAAVGTYQTVVVTYTLANGSGNTAGLAANYSLAAGSASGTITGRALTVTSAVVTSKAYDGTTVATITGTLSGALNSDTVSLVGTGTFASKNVGLGQAVTSTSTLSGTAAANYALTQPSGLTGTITAKALSIGAPTIASKVYDGTKAAGAVTVDALSGLVSPETLTVSGTADAYSSAAVGTYQTVVVTYTLANGSGNTAGLAANYSLAAGSASGTITGRALTVTSAVVTSKAYDGTTVATITGTLSGALNSDTVSLVGTGTFASKNVGANQVVTSTSTLSGTAAANYSLTQPTGLTGTITAKALSIGAPTIASKVYDGTTAAGVVTVGELSGLISPETLTVTGTAAAYGSAAVGTYSRVVTYTLANGSGNTAGLAANYSLAAGSASGTITGRALTVTSPVVTSKAYDGTTSATITGTLSGVLNSDVVTLVGTGTFASKNVGVNQVVTSTSTLSGAAAANYALTQPSGLTGTITAKALSIGAPTIASKVYDGTTAAGAVRVGELSGTVSPETLVVTGTAAAYSSAAVGTYQTVVVTYTLANGSGNTAGLAANYSLAAGSASGTITPRELVITVDPVSLMSDFDGQSHGVLWTTTPAGISVEVLYNGSTTLPKVAGSYSVALSSADPRFSARLEVTLVIRKSVQGITLSSAVVAAGLQTVSDSSGRYLLQATLGQPIAGPASAVSGMQLNSGFWFTEQFSAALDGRNLVGAKLESKIRASVILRGASIDAPEATVMGPEISRPALGVPPSTRLTVLPVAGSGEVWIRVSGVPSGRWLIQYQDRLHSNEWLDEGLVELDGDGLGAVRAATGVGEMRFYRLVQQ